MKQCRSYINSLNMGHTISIVGKDEKPRGERGVNLNFFYLMCEYGIAKQTHLEGDLVMKIATLYY